MQVNSKLFGYIFNFEIIAVFNNMRTLKLKPQVTVYVFRCRQSSKRTSWETEAHLSQTGQKVASFGRDW